MTTPNPARASRNTPARVIRAYTLPADDFDTLKAHQRSLQRRADQSARLHGREPHQVTNSDALRDLLGVVSVLTSCAEAQGVELRDYVDALSRSSLKTTRRGVL